MSKAFNIATLMIILIFSAKVFALESSDIMKTQILKAYGKNILVLNRGLEDAIFKKDHIKITSSEGFIARGICIKANMMTSHWKIYRVVRPELVSKDTLYDMKSINQSELPYDIKKYTNINLEKYLHPYGDKESNKQLKLQQERIAKYDLPEKVKETTTFKEVTKTGFDRFLERNINDKKLSKDLSNTYLDVFASPMSWQRRYDQKEVHYGAKLYNKGEKYRYEFHAVETQRDIADPVTAESYKSKSSAYSGHFQLNRVTDNWSIVSHVNYNREKIGDIYYPYEHYQVGPFGLKLHIWEDDKKDNFFEVSYTPTFDKFRYTDPTDAELGVSERTGMRHIVRLKLYSDLTEKLHSKTEINYAPYMLLEDYGVDYSDTMTNISTTLSYNLGGAFFADYTFAYDNDQFRATTYNISADNTTQTIRFRYEFDI